MKKAANIVLVVLSVVFGFVVSEGAYRVYLYRQDPSKFLFVWNRVHPSFVVFSVSHWEFDRRFGFIYPPGRIIAEAHFAGGKVTKCAVRNTINERGNIGPIRGKYRDADIKIAVFGDSFPAFIVGGETFPSRLQAILQKRTGKSVHVVNFGRDGYGVLQIFRLAAAKLPEWKPDIAILTFTTDDLMRVRIWRTATTVGGEARVLTTAVADPRPPIDKAQDTLIVDARVTQRWCERALAGGGIDPLVADLEFKYRRMAREAGYSFPDPLSLTHSYLLSAILHGDPYYTGAMESYRIPRLNVVDYGKDKEFVSDVRVVQAAGVPYILVHLPLSDEIAAGRKAILDEKEESLWQSLERLNGRSVLAVADYIGKPLANPQRMDFSPTNKHPSRFGMDLYAEAITRMLAEKGLVRVLR